MFPRLYNIRVDGALKDCCLTEECRAPFAGLAGSVLEGYPLNDGYEDKVCVSITFVYFNLS